MKRLIIFDLEGTLLNSNNQISTYSKNKIQELSLNNFVVLITSFSYLKAKQYYDELGLTTLMGTLEGAVINNVNYEIINTISYNEIVTIFKDLKEKLISMFYLENNTVFSYNYLNRYDFFLDINEETNYKEIAETNDNFTDTKIIYLIIEINFFEETLLYLKKKDIHIDVLGIDQTKAVLTIKNKKSNKKNALLTIKEYYKATEVIAIGDSLNDLKMLEIADVGILMKNSKVNSSLNRSEFTNNEDGAVKAILEVLEKKK